MMPPRAVFTRKASGFISPIVSVLNMFTVSGAFGQCTETKSTLGRIALRSVTLVAPAFLMSASEMLGSRTWTSISKATQRLTVREPMRPMPTTRIDLPARSAGRSDRRWPQVFSRTKRSCLRESRAEASSMYMACSATDTELAMPVVISGILRLLSAGISTASKPTPRRATTIMTGAASSSAWRNGVPPSVTALASLSLGCSDGTVSSVRIS